jgi:hypothetical protein
MEPSPIIIYGAARSGTTYLTHLLNSHPEVFITDESRLFAWVHQSLAVLPANDNLVRHQKTEFTGHLRANYPELIREFYRKLRPDARYWGDKNPHYAAPSNHGCLETITELFAGARFIHIIRDGRDVVASALRGNWRDFDGVHRMWTSHVDIGCAFGRQRPEQYFELRYEDLIRDDLGLARKIFEFLSISLAPQVVAFCEQQRVKRTPYCNPKRDIVADVTVSEWKIAFTTVQRRRSLELLGSHLVTYGYETEQSLAEQIRELREPASTTETPLVEVRKIVPVMPDIVLTAPPSDKYALRIEGRVARPVKSLQIFHDSRLLRECRPNNGRFAASVGVLGLPRDFVIEVCARLSDDSAVPVAAVHAHRQLVLPAYRPKLQPLLVTGLQRADATWLMRLLAEHPLIVADRRHPHEFDAAKHWLRMLRVLSETTNHGEPQPWYGRECIERLAAFCMESIDGCYQQLALAQNQSDARYFAERFPPEYLPDPVWELYPESREIIFVRDLRDIVCTIRAFDAQGGRAAGDRESDVIRKLRPDAARLVQRWKKRLAPGHLVRYEDLVLQPAQTLAGVFEYLGLPADVEKLVERVAQEKPETASIGRWRSDLSPTLKALCQETFGDLLVQFGYGDDFPTAATAVAWREAVCAHVPAAVTIAVVSKGDESLLKLGDRRTYHFPADATGRYAGYHPADSAEAIAQLEAARAKGAGALVFPRPSFWWLEYYTEFQEYLNRRCRRIWSDETCRIYQL